jgi:hypothetical protein
MLESAKFSNFGGHDCANHLSDVPPQEVTKVFRRLRCGNLPEGLQQTNNLSDKGAAPLEASPFTLVLQPRRRGSAPFSDRLSLHS